MSADNNLRGQAETAFNTAVKQFPDKVAISLLQLIRASSSQPVRLHLIRKPLVIFLTLFIQQSQIRELSTILLRKTLVAKESEEGRCSFVFILFPPNFI